jgi:hypothetical protein
MKDNLILQIKNDIAILDIALKSKNISVNDYCTTYTQLAKKLKSL